MLGVAGAGGGQTGRGGEVHWEVHREQREKRGGEKGARRDKEGRAVSQQQEGNPNIKSWTSKETVLFTFASTH